MSVFAVESREQFIAEVFPEELFPNGIPRTPTQFKSRDLYMQNPIDWSATTKRQLQAGILNFDEEGVTTVLREIAYLCGIKNTVYYYFYIWGELIFGEGSLREDLIGQVYASE